MLGRALLVASGDCLFKTLCLQGDVSSIFAIGKTPDRSRMCMDRESTACGFASGEHARNWIMAGCFG
jgi:hypothetical protein